MEHFRYLSAELVGLCLFDQNVLVETKRKILYAMINNPSPEVYKYDQKLTNMIKKMFSFMI